MQRLTKYSLLLVAIRKHVQDENNAEMIDAMVRNYFNITFNILIIFIILVFWNI